jgi:Uncharacterised nucleotidyltransferase
VEFSLERRLLLACARARLTAEDCQRICELAGPNLDWDQLVSVSYAHGIAPLVYHSLAESDVIGLVPAAETQTLRSSYYANAARNSLLYDDLKKLLLALRQEKIDVIVLKGAALSETVYSHRALRPMSDIDLLVRKEQLIKVESKLLAMGYLFDGHGKTKEFYLEHRYHWVFAKRSDIGIEMHWHIKRPERPFSIDIDGFWERAQWTKIAGVEALVLSPEDLVLYLCQHFWKHNLVGGIRPLCDIAETTRYYGDGIDWTKMANISSEWGMNAGSYLVLSLARELLDAPIPKDFLNGIKPVNFNMEVIDWAREAVLGYGECPLVFPDLVKLFWRSGSTKERWAILQTILSRKTVAGYANDSSASKRAYVYYPLRMKQLLTRYGPTVGRLWVGDQRIRAAAETEEKQQRLSKWLSDSSLNSPH